MCRDFSPQQVECGMSLIQVYMGNGLLFEAVDEMERVMRTVRKERQMLNNIRDWDCDVPSKAVEVIGSRLRFEILGSKSSPDGHSAEAKFVYLMVNLFFFPFLCFKLII